MTTLESFCTEYTYKITKTLSFTTLPFVSTSGLYMVATDTLCAAFEYNKNQIKKETPINTTFLEQIKDMSDPKYDYTIKKSTIRKILNNCAQHLILTMDNNTQGVCTDISEPINEEIHKKLNKKYMAKALRYLHGDTITIRTFSQSPVLIYSENKNLQFCLIMPA